jgi:hypothetical protein
VSIDREINSRVNAYSSNPQALQKKYSMSKDLVDLLALQKIKKGMDEERRNIAMAMQTNPATIKQQREQEVFGRTAQDVAQQLGGVLQTAKNRQQMAQRRPAPQGLGALMPQQGQRPQQPQRMQAGGIVAFQEGNLVKPPRTQEEQIQYLIDQNLTDEQIREEVKKLGLLPQAADQIIQQVRSKRLATAPAGPMEEVVVTGQRERAQPVQAIDKPSSKEAEPVSPGAKIDVTDYSQLLGPTETRRPKEDKTTAKKVAPKFTEVDGVRRQLNPDGSLVVLPAAETAPSMLEYMRQGSLDKIREKYLAGTPLSQNEMSMYDEYGPGMTSLEGQFGSGKSPQGITAVTKGTTGTSQVQPPRAEGIAAVADQPKPEPKDVPSDTPLIFRGQQNVPAGTGGAPSGGDTAPAKPQGFDLETALKEVDPVEYTPVDRTGTDVVGIERLKRFGMDPESLKSPEEVGKKAYDTAYEQLGIKAKDAERRAGLKALEDIDRAQTDPDKFRRDRLKAFLLGAAGRGSSTLAGAGAASMNLGRAQERGVRARQIKRNEMVAEIQNANTTLIQSAQARGDTATTRQANIINNAMQTLSQYDEAELAARRTDATNKMSVNIANYERKISEIELLAEQAQNRIQARIDRGDVLRDVQNDARDDLEAVSEQFNTLQAEAIQADPGVGRIDKEIAQELKRSNPDQDRLKSLRERRVVEIERVRQEFIIAHPRMYDLRQSLTNTINQLGSQIQSTLGVSSGTSGQQVNDAVQRQLRKGTPEYLQPYNP